jgi:hypothetical protein
MTESSEHRYGAAALVPDYLRAAGGVALTAGPLALVDLSSIMAWLLAGLGALFALHGVRTAVRQATVYRLDGQGLSAEGPWRRRVAWADLRGVRVRYFSTRRDRSNGWMQLDVRDSRARIGLDSTIDGFTALALSAARAAGLRELALDDATRRNLDALDPRAWS